MDLEIGQGDTLPLLQDRLLDPETQRPVPIPPNATVTWKTFPAGGGRTRKVVATVLDYDGACVQVAVPTDCPGVFLGQWVVATPWTPPAQETFPKGDYRRVLVTPTSR